MYHQQPAHGAGGPWAAPAPHAYFPGGDHAHAQHQQHAWPAPPLSQRDPPYPPQFAQPPGPSYGRPQPQPDAVNLRLKEEQRRRQQEYSQALAEQVHQREQHKQQEKEARRREDADGGHHGVAGPQGDRGLFDGLGQNNPSQRTNFGRGRREHVVAPVAPVNPPVGMNPLVGPPLQQQPPPYHAMPGSDMQHPQHPQHPQHHPQHQVEWSGHAEALGLVEPQHLHYGDPAHGQHAPPRQDAPWNPHPQQNLPPQAHQYQPQQPPQPPVGGRRVRTDLHDIAGAGGGEKQARLQQQLDMQESLRRQIEDKQRQKLEEKRKREDDERREMEKFEHDKRRQHEEQERLKDEKRRKAQADEEHFRVQQQQLAAANAAAQEQRHHRHHHSPSKVDAVPSFEQQSPPRNNHAKANAMPPQQQQSPPRIRQAQAPAPVTATALPGKNPFTNSRAHLFEDPPSPQHQHQHQHHHQSPPQHVMGDDRHHTQQFAASNHRPQNRSQVAPVDTHLLLEQYEQVRIELERQRQLVEQLHAQLQRQQQQQRQPREGSPRELPTVSDLERLRQELRDELAQREAQHRQELEALRRHHHHHQQSFPASPDALMDEDEDVEASLGHDDDRGNQKPSPRSSIDQSGLRGSLSGAALQCESKLVFFDGRVHQEHQQHQQQTPRTSGHGTHNRRQGLSIAKRAIFEEESVLEDDSRLGDSVDELVFHVKPSVRSDVKRATDNQHEIGAQSQVGDNGVDDGEDALGFFVRRFDRRELEPERYRSDSLEFSLSHFKSSATIAGSRSHGRVPILKDIEDEEDETDETDSLDGDSLEAIFQRNVRRHEILSGFEAQNQRRAPDATHWHELQRKLQGVPDEVTRHTTRAKAHHAVEPSLTASSRWMPSSNGSH